LGFVTRANPKASDKHTVLLTKRFKPVDFATQFGVKLRTLWGSLKFIIEMCMAFEDGKYLLLRDPNEPLIRVFSIPSAAFAHETGLQS